MKQSCKRQKVTSILVSLWLVIFLGMITLTKHQPKQTELWGWSWEISTNVHKKSRCLHTRPQCDRLWNIHLVSRNLTLKVSSINWSLYNTGLPDSAWMTLDLSLLDASPIRSRNWSGNHSQIEDKSGGLSSSTRRSTVTYPFLLVTSRSRPPDPHGILTPEPSQQSQQTRTVTNIHFCQRPLKTGTAFQIL